MAPTLEVHDMQGLIARGYRDLRAACYVLLAVADPNLARSWLADTIAEVTTAVSRPEGDALNIAFTRSGLEQLGLPADSVSRFSPEFVEGMTTLHRQRILGDIDESAPERWVWGGPETPRIDLVLMLFASDYAALDGLRDRHASRFAASGLQEVRTLETNEDLDGLEHFGFRDGVSQPTIEGLRFTDRPENTLKAGEFILGYENAYGVSGEPIPAPLADAGDLGRNGTYVVFRQLEQDVLRFWRATADVAQEVYGASDRATQVRVAAKMVGRWPSGAPLVRAPHEDIPAFAGVNDFAYHDEDRHGLACPMGAHVRRANPRDSLDPQPGSEQSVAAANHHRIIRRGREYGVGLPEPVRHGEQAPSPEHQGERGLYFIALNADIARQFEFVQHMWVNNPTFIGLYDEPDPLVGPGVNTFTVQAQPVARRSERMPRFVSVRGGAYFFMPGIQALRQLAHGATARS
ncbi:MAG: Dyp-type peroxidase [Dehalococcoidia bacterium]|nr:Dyp-type peroxidase [Dehalococcoidia bacterium]